MIRRTVYAALAFLCMPALVFAHEVYVLPADIVARDLSEPPLQVFQIISEHAGQFFFWAFITAWAIFTVFSISLSKGLERFFDPILLRLRRHAAFVGRVTLGTAIIASAYYGAMFGPELPFTNFLDSSLVELVRGILYIVGTCIVLGVFTRLAALSLIIFYIGMWPHYGLYMLTYANYLGEMVLALLAGTSALAFDRLFHHKYPHVFRTMLAWLEHHTFLILRVTFGLSLITASVYAKFIHAQLALDTVLNYSLTNFFPFDPAFIVLGAFSIELLLGLFFLFGIEIRFASLFLLFWLTLSLLYFGEAVWPHLILAGTAIAIFMRGYDRTTLEWGIMKTRNPRAKEPVL